MGGAETVWCPFCGDFATCTIFLYVYALCCSNYPITAFSFMRYDLIYAERGIYHIYVEMMLGRHDESIILAKDRIPRAQTTQNTNKIFEKCEKCEILFCAKMGVSPRKCQVFAHFTFPLFGPIFLLSRMGSMSFLSQLFIILWMTTVKTVLVKL